MSCIGNLGKTGIAKIPVAFNQQINAILPFEGIDPRFVFYQAQSALLIQQLEQYSSATTIAIVNKGNFERLTVRVAPTSEQYRVVAKIEELFSELDKGVESLQTAREQLKIFRQAVLKHAFEGKLTARWREENKDKLEIADQLCARIKEEREARYKQQLGEWKSAVIVWEVEGKPGKKPTKPRKSPPINAEDTLLTGLPKGWVRECVGNLNVDVFDGPFGANLKTSDYVDEGVRVIRLENIGYLEFIEEKHSYVTEKKYQSIKKHTVHAQDIIVSSFVTDGIRVAILPDSIERAVNKADCFCIRLHGEFVRNDFLASFLSTRAAYKQIESDIHGIGRPRINTTQLKNFSVPICSPEEQGQSMSRIADQLFLADHIGTAIEHEMGRCEALRQSILKRAFSGQLVEQDSNDEPAAVLLERIKAEKAAQTINKKQSRKRVAA